MISELKIYNILKHHKLTLQLEPITIIVGKNDRGKSSVLKALSWACGQFNTNVQRLNSKDSYVQLKIEDQIILKKKDNDGISYQLNAQLFNKVGTTVPVEVQNVLNVSSLNFQFQFDPLIISSQQLFTFLEDEVEIAEKVKEKLKDKQTVVKVQVDNLSAEYNIIQANTQLFKEILDLLPQVLIHLRSLLNRQYVLEYVYLKRMYNTYINTFVIQRLLLKKYVEQLNEYLRQQRSLKIHTLMKLRQTVNTLTQQYKTAISYTKLYLCKQHLAKYVQLNTLVDSYLAQIKYLKKRQIKVLISALKTTNILTQQYKTVITYTKLYLGKQHLVKYAQLHTLTDSYLTKIKYLKKRQISTLISALKTTNILIDDYCYIFRGYNILLNRLISNYKQLAEIILLYQSKQSICPCCGRPL